MAERLHLPPDQIAILDRIKGALRDLPGIVGWTLGGSTSTGLADASSDLDLHVYWQPPLASAAQRRAALDRIAGADGLHIAIHSWGLEDHLRIGGQLIELVYVNLNDLHDLIDRAYNTGLTDEGYTTASFHNIANGVLLHDPTAKLASLQQRLRTFPDPTRRHVLRYHPALLRYYLTLLEQAQARDDQLFVQHQRSAAQTVFFNMLFTLNRVYHPGAKRLLIHLDRCPIRPPRTAERWLHITRRTTDDPALPPLIGSLITDLIELIEQDGTGAIADYPW